MSFSQEMKDFLNAAQAGQKINASKTDQEYKDAQTDSTKKKTDRDNDPDTLKLQDDQARATLANTHDTLATNAAQRAGLAARTAYTNAMTGQIGKTGAVGDPGIGGVPGATYPQQPGQAPAAPAAAGALPVPQMDDPAYADGGKVPDRDDPGVLERISRSMNGGRDQGQRALYNATRDGIYTSRTAPADGGHPDALIQDLNTRRDQQRYESQKIDDDVRGTRRNAYADGGLVPPATPYRGLEGVVSPQLVHEATLAGITYGAKLYGLHDATPSKAYADGGLVDEEADDEDNEDGTTPAATGAVPLPPQVADANARGGGAGISTPNAFSVKGMGAIKTPEQLAKARLLSQGHNGLSDAEMQAAKKAVDPDGRLTDSQRNMAALGSVYQYFSNKGEGDKAERVAFQMLQHYRNATQRYAAISAHAAQTGDLDLATKAAVKAYANVPDGKDIHLEKSPDDPNKLIYYYTDEKGNDIAKGIATPQELASRAMGLASGGFDKAILSAAGQREADAKPKGAVHVQSAKDFSEEVKMATDASNSLKDAAAAKNKDKEPAPGDDEYWAEHRNVTQHIRQQNKNMTPDEAARAADLMLKPGRTDPEKPDFKVKPGEDGEPHTVDIGGKLKFKLDDDQLSSILNSRAARVKVATDKIDKDMEDSDKPGVLEKAGGIAKDIGTSVGNAVSTDLGKAKRQVEGAIPTELLERGKSAVNKALDMGKDGAAKVLKWAADDVRGDGGVTMDSAGRAISDAAGSVANATRNKGAIPIDDNDRPL
jgi:hypothetical protein